MYRFYILRLVRTQVKRKGCSIKDFCDPGTFCVAYYLKEQMASFGSGTERVNIMLGDSESAVDDLAARILRSENIDSTDIVGCKVSLENRIVIFHYPLVKNIRTSKTAELPPVEGGEEAARRLKRAILKVAGLPSHQRKMCVVINPKSGQGRAQEMWKMHCSTLLEEHANISFAASGGVRVTTRAGEGTEIAQGLDLQSCPDGILAVGGDGTVYEVVQGLMSRDDRRLVADIPLALVPGGSGNAWSCSVLYQSKMGGDLGDLETVVTNMAFVVARGSHKPFDLSVAENETQGKMYSFLSLSWGFGSEVDIGSEKCRCCGGLRFTVYALQLIWCSCATFNGVLHYLPYESASKDAGTDNGAEKDGEGLRLDNHLLPALNKPIGQEEYDKGWKTVPLNANKFFLAAQLTYLSYDMKFAPESKLDDGIISIQIVDRANPCLFTKLLLDLETGDHLNGNTVTAADAVALRLEPTDGMVLIDGEVMKREPIQMQIHQGALRAFCLP